MNRKDSPQSVIDSYRKRQQMAPYFVAGLAILLVVVGIVILVIWFTGSGQEVSPAAMLATPSVTVTETATATQVPPTATPTQTATETLTPTITETPTPSGPFEYTIQEGDNCWDIAQEFKVDMQVLQAINNFGTGCPINPGDKILIPLEGSELPTETPLPTDLPRGTKIEYQVKTGDTLAIIAERFYSTVDAIMKENKITDVNKIEAGQTLIVPYYIATPVPTKAPTNTITPGGPTFTPTSAATATPTP